MTPSRRTRHLLTIGFAFCFLLAAFANATAHAAPTKPTTPSKLLEAQVWLDRLGYSPGEIDGYGGSKSQRALAEFQRHEGSANPTGRLDIRTYRQLKEKAAAQALVAYTITEQDVAGPYVEIPEETADKAKLSALAYSSILEAFGERFHASPKLLTRLNPGVRFAASEVIQVPNVAVSEERGPLAKIVVSKSHGDLKGLDDQGKVAFYAPVSSGSEHDPLPIGSWEVTSIAENPTYFWNPELFWDADPSEEKAKLAAGPNNPVGLAWIGISKEHFGLHGTPEPAHIGRSQSSGCVRLTNWDALRLLHQVKVGTPVEFVE